MVAVIRSAGLRGFRAVTAELGGDADAYARAAGMPVDALDYDDLMVPDVAIAAILEIASRDLECLDIGLKVAARQSIDTLGQLAGVLQSSATVADALDSAQKYLFVHAQSLVLRSDALMGSPGITVLRWGPKEGLPIPVHATDLGLGLTHRVIEALVGGSYGLMQVDLPYDPPAGTAAHSEFFGVPIETGRVSARLHVPSALLARELPTHDEYRLHVALARLLADVPTTDRSVGSRVAALVEHRLGVSPVTLEAIAALLQAHPRTLQRSLADEGSTFADIVDDVRRRVAHSYLTTSQMPLGQVASALGLSEQSALSRCCRRWWSLSPSAVRREGRVSR